MTKKRSRVPLDSFGEGMRRLLALSLSLSDCTDGLLLVDEIDTGLHWTVMEDLWQLVIGAARDRNVQVFATTHSYDCVKGFASLLEREPELAEEVSLQKLERRLDEAVALRGEQLPIADHPQYRASVRMPTTQRSGLFVEGSDDLHLLLPIFFGGGALRTKCRSSRKLSDKEGWLAGRAANRSRLKSGSAPSAGWASFSMRTRAPE